MKSIMTTMLFLFAAVAYGQNNSNGNVTVNVTNNINNNNTAADSGKVAALENEVQRLKAEQRKQLLRTYAKDWQMNRAAEAPHVLARKLKIEKEALKDGFTVEDMKKYLEEEKKAKKQSKKKK